MRNHNNNSSYMSRQGASILEQSPHHNFDPINIGGHVSMTTPQDSPRSPVTVINPNGAGSPRQISNYEEMTSKLLQIAKPGVSDHHHNTKNFSSEDNPFFIPGGPAPRNNINIPQVFSAEGQQEVRYQDYNHAQYERQKRQQKKLLEQANYSINQ
jgi:hypothetical protein